VQHLGTGQFAVNVFREPLPATFVRLHTDLNATRKLSRARANRDFTVPTTTPSETAISS
jgi:hypothetical protein